MITKFGEDPSHNPAFADTVRLGVEYLRISVLGYPFVAIGISLSQALNGAASVKMPIALDTFGFLLTQVRLAWWLSEHHAVHGFTRAHLWWTLVGTAVLVAALYVLVWKRGHWKHKKIR